MGYRDSDDSNFSRHGMGRDHGAYPERSYRDEPRWGSPDYGDRNSRHGQSGPYRGDYRENDQPAQYRQDRYPPADRFEGPGGYRNDGRDLYSSNNRFGSDDRNGPDPARQGAQRLDPDYQQWRQEQLRLLDEDYQSWRKERYQKFSEDFNTWRSSRSNHGNQNAAAKEQQPGGKSKDAS